METSKKYIKMCEKTEEIQKMYFEDNYPHDETIKDYLVCKKHKLLIIWLGKFACPYHRENCIYWTSRDNVIWLPRQDQLQEMSGLCWQDFDTRCCLFSEEDTKEKAGIKVVMHEKYRRRWNDKKEMWIKK